MIEVEIPGVGATGDAVAVEGAARGAGGDLGGDGLV